jgi:O-succinylbenzoic acid--CoA ligase
MGTDLVAVRLPSRRATTAAIERIHGAGDAVAPLDPHQPDAVAADLLRRLRPAALVHARPDGTSRVTRLDGGLSVPAGTAAVVTTSGSTGAPRPIVLSAGAMDASARASVTRLGCADGDRWLLCLPLHHVAGLQVLRRGAVLGSRVDIVEDFTVAAVARSDARWLALVPTMLVRLLDAGVDLAGRGILLGGAAAPPDLLLRARDAGADVVTSYGMTETCGGCVYDGVPLDGVEVTVRPDGRIAIAGSVVATGERGAEGATTPVVDDDGWFVTSDRGRWVDGRLEVLGRADAVILTGGENVAAEAVERCLRDHPAVVEAGVLGVPDPEWGQRVVALIVPAGPGAPPTLDTLRAHVRERLGSAAAPREVHVVAALPHTSLGKIVRGDLPALLPPPSSP